MPPAQLWDSENRHDILGQVWDIAVTLASTLTKHQVTDSHNPWLRAKLTSLLTFPSGT
jgi:hypothetical protein